MKQGLRSFVDFFFCFWRELILTFFSLWCSITCCWGMPWTLFFQLGRVLPNNVYVDYNLFRKFFLGYSLQIFFPQNFVSAILEVCLELEFFIFFRVHGKSIFKTSLYVWITEKRMGIVIENKIIYFYKAKNVPIVSRSKDR